MRRIYLTLTTNILTTIPIGVFCADSIAFLHGKCNNFHKKMINILKRKIKKKNKVIRKLLTDTNPSLSCRRKKR